MTATMESILAIKILYTRSLELLVLVTGDDDVVDLLSDVSPAIPSKVSMNLPSTPCGKAGWPGGVAAAFQSEDQWQSALSCLEQKSSV
jgi:hypothetical protein